MAKNISTFTCADCGAVHARWSGRCDACGAWNSITEERPLTQGSGALKGKRGATISLVD
ncbi:MAG TPA: DNA repair protein RadA, partial [Rhodobacteraceae bacterium]|nr:DNA repair protein RadA [Paracoccaceae bacterium]